MMRFIKNGLIDQINIMVHLFPQWLTDLPVFIVKITADLLTLLPATNVTLLLAITSLFFGLILAMFLTTLELSKIKVIARLTTFIITLIRGIPEILIVIGVYNAIPIFFNLLYDGFYLNLGIVKWWIQSDFSIDISPFFCGVIALSLLYAAYASQTLRGAIKAVPVGQVEAAKALCLSKTTTFFKIVFPQMWRYAIPGLANQWLILLKDTALVSLITVNDLMYQVRNTAIRTDSPFTWFLLAALIYLIITFISQGIIKLLNYRVTRFDKLGA